MVPRDLFEKMAALALIAIILSAILSINAFAAEVRYLDSGMVVDIESDGTLQDLSGLQSEIIAIRQDIDIFLYFVIPCSAAILFVYFLCRWFCSTFVDSVL